MTKDQELVDNSEITRRLDRIIELLKEIAAQQSALTDLAYCTCPYPSLVHEGGTGRIICERCRKPPRR